MWIFNSPKNYSEMVDKISKCSFLISLLLLYFLSCCNNDLYAFLNKISFGIKYELIGIKLTLAGAVLPLLVGIAEHIFKIHDKVSTILKIRKKYDKEVIVCSFLRSLGFENQIPKLKDDDVSKLMSCCFYRYASSTNPQIDSHNILLALNEWCWFWIILDTEILLSMTGVAFLIIRFSWKNLLFVLLIVSSLLYIMWLINKQCSSYTKSEVDDILNNLDRKEKIRADIKNAL